MDIEDIVRIGFILLIASGFLFRGAGRNQEDEQGEGVPGPRSLGESGGSDPQSRQRNVTPQPVRTSTTPANPTRPEAPREELRERYGGLLDTSGLREEALERGLSAGSLSAEEQRPHRPRRVVAPPVARVPVGSGQIRQLLANRQSVQTAFVLQDVLGKPVGMREDMQ